MEDMEEKGMEKMVFLIYLNRMIETTQPPY